MDILKTNHAVLVLNNLLYSPGYIEFVSEFINQLNKYNPNIDSMALQKILKEYFSILFSMEYLFVKNGEDLFDKTNEERFFTILDDKWDEFVNKNNPNHTKTWYDFIIVYSDKWILELKKLNLYK